MTAHGEHFLVPRLEAALRRAGGLHTLADVLRACREGRARLWQSDDERGVIVTELNQFPRAKVVNYWLAAGHMGAVMSLPPSIEEWARGEGCTLATAMGRPGWNRVMPRAGPMRPLGVSFIKDL